jgi:hypothetical protein
MNRSLRHPKRRGEWVELQFMARAHAHGLVVSKPWGDSARYDFVVERRGRFRRVQVKSTMQTAKHKNGPRGSYLCNTISRGPSKRTRTYSARDVDFFALFVIPLDLWYIVPLADLPHACYALLLDTTRPGNKYFRYLEAWHLLK